MHQNQNTIVTPLVTQAYKLHKIMFNTLYPYPFNLKVENKKIFLKVDNIFKRKYIPFLFSLIVISFVFGLGSCTLVLVLKLFHKIKNVPTLEIFVCTFLGSCGVFEGVMYYAYCKSTESELFFNQLFAIERTCKCFHSIQILKYLFHPTFNSICICRLPRKQKKLDGLGWNFSVWNSCRLHINSCFATHSWGFNTN